MRIPGWQQVTLQTLPLSRWQAGSWLSRGVGLLGMWRTSSWLLRWAEPLGVLLIAIALGFAPFFDTTLIGVLLIACGAYWILLTLSDTERPGMTPIHLALGLYWGLMIVATAFSPEKKVALAGLIKFSLFLLFFLLAARVLRSPRWRNWLITGYLNLSLIISSYGLRQAIHGVDQLATWNDPTSPLADSTRVYSYLGNPNLLSSYVIPAIAFSLAACFIWRGTVPKLLALTTLFINTACLYYTGSRGGWIALILTAVVFFLLLRYWFADLLPRFWRKWLIPLVFGTFAAMLMAAILTVEAVRLRVTSIFAGRGDSSNNYRINVWESVFNMIGDYPLVGIGPGNGVFKKVYPLYARAGFENALGAYSVFLEHILEIGWFGFASFLLLLIVTVGEGLRHLNALRTAQNLQAFWLMAALASGVGLLTQGLFDTVWYRPAINTLWWLMVAIVASFAPAKGAIAPQSAQE